MQGGPPPPLGQCNLVFSSPLPLCVGCLAHSKAVKPSDHPDMSLVELEEVIGWDRFAQRGLQILPGSAQTLKAFVQF